MIQSHKGKRQRSDEQSVCGADPAFLPDERPLLLRGELLIHQHTDRDRQRLGANVARHIQHERLEADHKGQLRHNLFK